MTATFQSPLIPPKKTASSPSTVNNVDYGHHFDTRRHWAASLTLRFGAFSTTNTATNTACTNTNTLTQTATHITRMTVSRHYGPLRVQRAFYPEGHDGCCHVYLLHPPGGIASGDSLTIDVTVDQNAHTLLTTPAANKLYKADSNGVAWEQQTRLKVAKNAVLEWLPQETLAFNGSLGKQTVIIDLQDSAKCLGWEIMALGRPASNLPFASGKIEQHFKLTQNGRPLWLERQVIDPMHPRFKGKWGQGGATVHATLWAVGLSDADATITELRGKILASTQWAVTHRRGVLLLRYLGDERNEAWELMQQARQIIRPMLTGDKASIPRIWLT